MKLSLKFDPTVNVERTHFEAVERKGIGHPDTLCDAIAELASRRYSEAVYTMTGRLPHHYFDKVMLMGGAVDMGLGHGELIEPYRVIFAGKVTRKAGDVEFPVTELLTQAASEVLVDTLHNFDPKRHLVVMDELRDYQGPAKKRPRYQPEKVEDMPVLDQPNRVSNDVNICTGFYPLSKCESVVIDVEEHLNSKEYKQNFPYTGMDIKVAGVRVADDIEVTVNIPFIAPLVESMDQYKEYTGILTAELRSFLDTHGYQSVRLTFNPQDVSGLPYLSVTGSVADTGDVGVVGRGNRPNGIITPMRPMSIEAVSGKSPIDNTGKMYGIIANRISKAVYEKTGYWNNVTIVTFRDRALDDPANILLSLDTEYTEEVETAVSKVVSDCLAETPNLTRELIFEGITSW
jgi:S-adenosylmethionine synthetase